MLYIYVLNQSLSAPWIGEFVLVMCVCHFEGQKNGKKTYSIRKLQEIDIRVGLECTVGGQAEASGDNTYDKYFSRCNWRQATLLPLA